MFKTASPSRCARLRTSELLARIQVLPPSPPPPPSPRVAILLAFAPTLLERPMVKGIAALWRCYATRHGYRDVLSVLIAFGHPPSVSSDPAGEADGLFGIEDVRPERSTGHLGESQRSEMGHQLNRGPGR